MVDYNLWELIRVVLVFVIYTMLPGYLLLRLLFKNDELTVFEQVPFAFCLGVSLDILIGLVIHFSGLTIVATPYFFLPIVTGLLIASVLWRRIAVPRWTSKSDWRKLAWCEVGLVILVVGMLIVSLWSGADLLWRTDAWAHIANTRAVLESGLVIPPDAHRPELKQMPNIGLWQYVLAEIVTFSGVGLVTTWDIMTAILVPLILLSVYAFSKNLFQNKDLGLISTILFFLWYGGQSDNWFQYVAYPNRVNLPFLLLALLCFFWYLRGDGQKKFLVLGAVFGAISLTIHALEYLDLWFAVTSFTVAFLLFARGNRRALFFRTILFALLLASLSLPYMLHKYPDEISAVSRIVQVPGQSHEVAIARGSAQSDSVAPTLGMFHLVSSAVTSIPGYLVVLLAIGLLKYRDQDWAVFLFGHTLGYTAVLYVPFLNALFQQATQGFFPRRTRVFPWLVVGYYAYDWGIQLLKSFHQQRRQLQRTLQFTVLLVTLLPYGLSIIPLLESYSPHRLYEDRVLRSPLVWQAAFSFLDTQIAPNATLLSDPATSYVIPAFTRHHVVEGWPSHRNIYGKDYKERIHAEQEFLTNPYQTSAEAKSVLDRYNVDYIVVNLSDWIDAPFHFGQSFYNSTTLPFLRQNPQYFEEIYAQHPIYVFRYLRDAEFTGFQGKDQPRPVVSTSPEIPRIRNEINVEVTESLRLLGYDVSSSAVSPGMEVRVTTYWQALRRLEDDYVVFTAMLHPYPAWNIKYLGKPLRKVMEVVARQRYKANSFHMLPRPTVPPRLWEAGEIFEDETLIQIPSNAIEGKYELGVYVMEKQRYKERTFFERILLEDEDQFAGAVIGSIEVR